MSIIRTGLFAVMERFPHCKADIKQLFSEDYSFQTLCEDYKKCAEALQHWKKSTSKEGVARQKEYAALLRDLEAEILENLTHKTRSYPS